MQHQCKVCHQVKDVEEFTKHIKQGPYEPWNLRQCKQCSHEKYLYRVSIPENVAAMQNASNNWKKKNPEKHARLAREYRERNKEKTLAQNKLNYAIRKGRIQRQPCEVCGTTEKVHAHHKSYAPEDWYNVRWMCFLCHKIKHTLEE